jgi:hypothetical protein
MPTIPSLTLDPSSAIQSPLRIDNAGRRTADGLPGCAAQYDSISSNAIRAGSVALKAFSGITLVFLLTGVARNYPSAARRRTIRHTADLCIRKSPMLPSRPIRIRAVIRVCEMHEHVGDFKERSRIGGLDSDRPA